MGSDFRSPWRSKSKLWFQSNLGVNAMEEGCVDMLLIQCVSCIPPLGQRFRVLYSYGVLKNARGDRSPRQSFMSSKPFPSHDTRMLPRAFKALRKLLQFSSRLMIIVHLEEVVERKLSIPVSLLQDSKYLLFGIPIIWNACYLEYIHTQLVSLITCILQIPHCNLEQSINSHSTRKRSTEVQDHLSQQLQISRAIV